MAYILSLCRRLDEMIQFTTYSMHPTFIPHTAVLDKKWLNIEFLNVN